MADELTNEQLRAISPFLVKDYDVLMLSGGTLKPATITLSSTQNNTFAINATDWEKKNCPLLTGSQAWKPIVDEAGTIVAYTTVTETSGVFHLWVRDINGEVMFHQTVAEKPLEPDPLGDALAATIITLGGALIVRSLAAGIGAVAARAVASGARIVSLAVSRIIAGETTDGVVLTALRSIRAQAIVKALRARGLQVIVNIGGEAGPEEVLKWGADQIALNDQVRFGIARRFVPNLVKENGEQIGEVFGQNTIDKIVSRRLDAEFDVNKLAQGAYRVLRPGGTVEMQIYTHNPNFAEAFTAALRQARFKNVQFLNATANAVK